MGGRGQGEKGDVLLRLFVAIQPYPCKEARWKRGGKMTWQKIMLKVFL